MSADLLIGRARTYNDRLREWVTIDFGLQPRSGGQQTVDHEWVDEALEFTAAGMIMLAVLVDPTFEPVSPWTAGDVRSLHDLWQRWRLNQMRAACAHMDLPDDPSYDARRNIVCPVTGYRYGSAWLYEPIPESVIAEIRRLEEVASRAERWQFGTGPVAA
jgi:hypothetical protein